MFLFIFFIILSLTVGLSFFFGRHKFAPHKLLISLWLMAIGVAQLRLSPYEEPWPWRFWLILTLFFGLFYIFYQYFYRSWQAKIAQQDQDVSAEESRWFWVFLLTTLATLTANIYIFNYFGTLPIISSAPDKLRFIINKEIFGVWEYLALLPRLTVPLSVLYLLTTKTKKKWPRVLAVLNIIFGFAILALYASRVVMVSAILVSYFAYLILKIKKINYQKIMTATTVVVLVVLIISIAIPVLRQHITYRDYQYEEDAGAFSYIVDLSQLRIPDNLRFLTPLYIIPSFNLQALMRTTSYYGISDWYFGQYNMLVFNKALNILGWSLGDISVPWKDIFLPWWVTGTFLFSYWVDFGWLGMILAALIWAGILSGAYVLAIRRPSILSVILLSYFGFVVVMTIYTNYFTRAEFYLDLAIILLIGLFLLNKKY